MQVLDEKPLLYCLAVKENPLLIWHRFKDRYDVINVVMNVQLQSRLSDIAYKGQVTTDYISEFE